MVGLLIATAVLVLVVAALSRSHAAATAKPGQTRTRPDANATAALLARLATLDDQLGEMRAALPQLTEYYPETAVRGVSHELDTAELALNSARNALARGDTTAASSACELGQAAAARVMAELDEMERQRQNNNDGPGAPT
jgi:hypothetical protein